MALTIVEEARPVTGGVDTHAGTHVAAALDPVGGHLGGVLPGEHPFGTASSRSWASNVSPSCPTTSAGGRRATAATSRSDTASPGTAGTCTSPTVALARRPAERTPRQGLP